MSDYNKLTVANLRQLLKDRGIPSTGLTRKAQIVEKLEEQDLAKSEEAAESADANEETPTAVQDEAVASEEPVPAPVDSVVPESPSAKDHAVAESSDASPASEHPEDRITPAITVSEQTVDTLPAVASEGRGDGEEKELQRAMSEPATEPTEPSQPDVQIIPTQIQTQDFAMPDVPTPSSDPNAQPSVEKVELLPIPEQDMNTSVEASRLNTEELEADTKKRKRRSQSPEVPSQDIRAKKPRPSDNIAPDVHLKEDKDVVMEQRAPELGNTVDTIAKNLNGAHDAEAKTANTEILTPLPSGATPTADDIAPSDEPQASSSDKKEKGARYKDLFQDSGPTPSTELPTDDRPIIPALHPATPAIYIRDFMRPLKPEALRNHLISLASPPSSSPDPAILKSLFLDPVKTHALVLFANTTAASRVRSSLHGSIWPLEGQRKELWVDFVPEDKVEDWIREEEDAIAAEKESRATGRPIQAKRYEVIYPESQDGGIEAIFQEMGARAPPNAPRGPKASIDHFRRGSEQAPPPAPTVPKDEEVRKDLGKSFQTLDQLFDSTTAKPKLYFLPVSNQIADRRREDLRLETSRYYRPEEKVRGRGAAFSRLDQKARFSFDDEDRIIDVGGDFGPWRDDTGFRGGRGGRGGFRGGGGGGGGGYRGPRGGGVGYRGGGRLD